MKKVNSFLATATLAALTFAFTTKPVSFNDDNPMLKIVEGTFHNAMGIKPTNDRNHDFIHYIQALHNGAMQLANYELTNGHHPEVKTLAQMTIDTMKQDMILLSRYMSSTQPKEDIKEKFANEAHDELDELIKQADNTKLNGDVDHDYAALMPRLVDAERDVAKAYIRFGADTRLERLAKRLVEDKKEEKKDLKEGATDVKREDKK